MVEEAMQFIPILKGFFFFRKAMKPAAGEEQKRKSSYFFQSFLEIGLSNSELCNE